jgi:hypothetical protein
MNPYFVVERPDSLEGWSPLSDLTSPPVLFERAERTRSSLGSGPLRAAASVDFLGVAARVLSPVLASLVASAATPLLALDTVWWRAAVPGPMRLASTSVASPSLSPSLHAAVVEPVLMPLVDAYAETFALSRKVLWGSVASALNGAAITLRADVTAVLSAPPLAGTARTLAPHFVRNSCCLLYQFPGAGTCGDCVLRQVR